MRFFELLFLDHDLNDSLTGGGLSGIQNLIERVQHRKEPNAEHVLQSKKETTTVELHLTEHDDDDDDDDDYYYDHDDDDDDYYYDHDRQNTHLEHPNL